MATKSEESKRDSAWDWYRIREMFGDKCFKTDSDAGGVLVGNEEFNLIVPNGYGDGTTRIAVFHRDDKFDASLMKYFVGLNGKFNIYSHDCSFDLIEETLEGEFAVYYYDGLVAFVEC